MIYEILNDFFTQIPIFYVTQSCKPHICLNKNFNQLQIVFCIDDFIIKLLCKTIFNLF